MQLKLGQQFILWSGILVSISAAVIATIQVSLFIGRSGCKPFQVHLAFTGNTTEMRVSWSTRYNGCRSFVNYWSQIAEVRKLAEAPHAQGSSKLYNEGMMCSKPAAHDKFSLHQHTAILTGLDPGERYSYQINGDDHPRAFLAPSPIGPDQPVTFIGFGDMGHRKHVKCPGAGPSMSTIQNLLSSQTVDLILHVGDLSYGDGHPQHWEDFMYDIEPIAQSVPYMISIGNHEYDYLTGSKQDPSGVAEPYHPTWGNYGHDSGGECGAMASARFSMPGARDAVAGKGMLYGHVNSTQIGGISCADNNISSSSASDMNVDTEDSSSNKNSGSSSSINDGSAEPSGSVSYSRRALRITAADTNVDFTPNPSHAHSSLPKTGRPQQQAHSAVPTNNLQGPSNVPLTVSQNASSTTTYNGPDSTPSDVHSNAPCNTPYAPYNGPAHGTSNAPFWYSFDVGSVHFTILSTEHSLDPSSSQHHWLAKDLASVDRCLTPWLVVGLHRPMYVVKPHRSNRVVGEHIRNQIEPLLIRHRVDATLSGHVHLYARTCAVKNETCIGRDEGGIHHIVAGTAGRTLSRITHIQPFFERAMQEFGVVLFTVKQGEMKVEFVGSQTGEVLDSVTLPQRVPEEKKCGIPGKIEL